MSANDRPIGSTGRSNRSIHHCLFATIALLLLSPIPSPRHGRAAPPVRPAAMAAARKTMIEEILIPTGVKHPDVLRVMGEVPRHEFVPAAHRRKAYFDMALPIGHQQTISAPLIVALMTESLDPQPTDKVLEIGTGSGYQAAVLSGLVKEVYSIEIIPELGTRAERTLKRLLYTNVHVLTGDGFQGWPDHAPFDKIIVTCSPERVPQPLVDQLREGGRMVIPVGERYQQILYLMTRREGKIVQEAIQPTLFVPMTGTAESNRQLQPDGTRPQIINADFEEKTDDPSIIPGWYYQRQVQLAVEAHGEKANHYLKFTNTDPGRAAQLFQGFALDGTQVRQLDVWARVGLEDVAAGPDPLMRPNVVVSFYNRQRRDVGEYLLGPWEGTRPWGEIHRRVNVPAAAVEAIIRVGLFGGTGTAMFDDVRVAAVTSPGDAP